jgi:hypothetical protein
MKADYIFLFVSADILSLIIAVSVTKTEASMPVSDILA